MDGSRRTGDFLLVEVLNTRAVGPNLEFAPSASTSDGLLSVVTAREGDRQALADYIANRLAGREGRLELATETANCVEIDDPEALHVDDELVQVPGGVTASIRIAAAAVDVLVPPPA